MKIRIVYHSSTGNTHQIARAIAAGLAGHGHEVMAELARDFDPRSAADCDLLGVGSAVYAWKHAEVLDRVLEALPDLYIKPAFLFLTYSGNPGNTFKYMRDKLAKRRAKVLAHHGCRAEESYPWLRTRLGIPGLGHPDEHDLDTAKAFADRVLQEQARFAKNPAAYQGQDYPLKKDWTYWLSLTAPFGKMDRTIGRRRVDRERCVRCGTCVKRCPSGCLKMSDQGPMFGSGCIGCCACFNLCPEDAISAAAFPGRRSRYRGRWHDAP